MLAENEQSQQPVPRPQPRPGQTPKPVNIPRPGGNLFGGVGGIWSVPTNPENVGVQIIEKKGMINRNSPLPVRI